MSHPLLTEYPVIVRAPVQWGEMDAYGHVNNTVYFRWFESARIAYLDACGFLESYEQDRVGAILHSTDCRFRHALQYPDELEIGGRALSVEADRFTMGYAVVSVAHDRIVAEGSGVIVSFDYTSRRKTDLPEAVRNRIAALEGQA